MVESHEVMATRAHTQRGLSHTLANIGTRRCQCVGHVLCSNNASRHCCGKLLSCDVGVRSKQARPAVPGDFWACLGNGTERSFARFFCNGTSLS